MRIEVDNVMDGPDVAPRFKLSVFSDIGTEPVVTLTPDLTTSRQLVTDLTDAINYFQANAVPK